MALIDAVLVGYLVVGLGFTLVVLVNSAYFLYKSARSLDPIRMSLEMK